jgi:putative glutathione S-transferase
MAGHDAEAPPAPTVSADGRFVRPASAFRNWVTRTGDPGPTGEGGFAAEPGRYHLYVALACPWASRTLVGLRLKPLDGLISLSIVEPAMGASGWRFGAYPGATEDEVNSAATLREVYELAEPGYAGRATVPLLWDKARRTIVNNESAEILRMLDSAFAAHAPATPTLYPDELAGEIDALNQRIYDGLNNGVYRAGFAKTQQAYETAVCEVFECLDGLEEGLADRPYLFGDRITEADIRLFVTLVRFDPAYHFVFKCNLRRLADYPRLSAYLERLLDIPAFAETVSIDHIKRGYYSMAFLNPPQVVAAGPDLVWFEKLRWRPGLLA